MNVQKRLDPGKYRLRIEDYLFLEAAGVFKDSRTELLDGEIIIMNAEYRPHTRVASELAFRLRLAVEALGSGLAVLGGSVALSEIDMPLPDVVLTSEPDGEGAIPARSVALIVEVSSTTLDRDLREKQGRYARAGVPEYWVADVTGRVIHQMWIPAEDSYSERREMVFGERIVAATMPALAVATAGL